MTTAHSPLRVLKAQADECARLLKAIERGENPSTPFAAKLVAARSKDSIKFGVAMDDKLLTIEMAWATVRGTSEAGIAEYILRQMRGSRDRVQ